MRIRQSAVESFSRCPQQKKLSDEVQARGDREANLSATVFGTVMHHALQVLETLHYEGRADAADVAVATFERYWGEDLAQLEPHGIDIWLPRQTWQGLMTRGRHNIREYAATLASDRGFLLGLETTFDGPLLIPSENARWQMSPAGVLQVESGDVEEHVMTGTIDRLAFRIVNGKTFLSVEDFKGLALDTPLPTPTGWTSMGQVQVGDRLLGVDGEPCVVTAKSRVHHRPCYRVRFDDGSDVVADNVHLWECHTDAGVQVLSTERMAGRVIGPRGQRDLRIPNAAPLELPEVDLPIPPYVLGVWLGDGKHTSGEVTKPDREIFARCAAEGFPSGAWTGYTKMTSTLIGLRPLLRKAGLLGNKHVPAEYLRAGYKQRLELLRGLMDTDGTWHRSRRRAVFSGCDRALCEAVFELVASLGWRPSMFEVERSGYGKTVTAWDVTFVPLEGVNPFHLQRKAELVDVASEARASRRLVVSVEPVESVPTQCVQVDAPRSLYLVGRQMVPTHNSGQKKTFLRYAFQWTYYSYATLQPWFWEMWSPEQLGPVVEGLDKKGLALWPDGTDRPVVPRRGRWLSVKGTFKAHDTGWRTAADYARMLVGLREYVRAHERDVFPLNIAGDTCQYCVFGQTGECGGVPLGEIEEGVPT